MPPEGTEILQIEPGTAPEQAVTREPFWDYTDLALIVGLLVAAILLMLLVVGFLSMHWPSLRNDPTPLILPTQFVLYGLIYVCFAIVFRLRYDKPVFSSIGWRRSHFNLFLAGIGGALLALVVSGIAALLHTPKVDSPIDRLTQNPVSLAVFAVMAVAIAPLFEELLFRGFLQPLLARTFGVVVGVLLTSLLFGALHGPEYSWAWQYIVAVSLAGAVFGWTRARTNSIIPCTVMHGCYNSLFVAALIIKGHQ
jgi:membrane protease YdiL (CAAX protease family)